jgi:hypothetical protein
MVNGEDGEGSDIAVKRTLVVFTRLPWASTWVSERARRRDCFSGVCDLLGDEDAFAWSMTEADGSYVVSNRAVLRGPALIVGNAGPWEASLGAR